MNRVSISPYDPAWTQRFREEAPKVAKAIGDPVKAIEHVGSTAIPGLDAKPTIDILVGVGNIADVGEEAELAMEKLGYEFRGELGVPGRRYFRKGATYPREFNVHVVELGGSLWRRNVAFRDYLRKDANEAKAYGELKRKLISRPGGVTLERYAAGKADFIAGIVTRAVTNELPE